MQLRVRQGVAWLAFLCTVVWICGTGYALWGTHTGVPPHAPALLGAGATIALLGLAMRAVGADDVARLLVAMIAPMATVASITELAVATHRLGLILTIFYGFACVGTILALLTACIRRYADDAGLALVQWILDFFLQDVAGLLPTDAQRAAAEHKTQKQADRAAPAAVGVEGLELPA